MSPVSASKKTPKKTPAKKTAAAANAASPATAASEKRFVWRKLSAAKWGDAWLERLTFLGPQRGMVIEFPGAKTVRVEAHSITRKEADGLLKLFGGKVTAAKTFSYADPEPRPPIRVRNRLVVVSTEEELREAEATMPSRAAVLVPAGMAFGTGEHATTATCLRFLADIATALPAGKWEALDLGTGSGILAICAAKFGASKVEAGDYDPHAVRTAKENVRANGLKKISVKKMDVRDWTPDRTWELVCSNLFSGLLVETAPKIAKAVAKDGWLIFSGILRVQEAEVIAAFEKSGITVERIVRKGKWVSGIGRRLAKKRK